jgi:NADPH:quinone reductase-like Zn-dependent oxidoreductase
MKLRYKILSGILAFLVVVIAAFMLYLSHDSACHPAPPIAATALRMRAIVYHCYGAPTVLKLEAVAKPVPADDRVLVRVHAASLNPLDWHYMRGAPYIVRMEAGVGAPDDMRTGVDFAGTVEAVGKNVKLFRAGDEVFGGADGAFAEYVTVGEHKAVALKPANISFEQAAAIPIAAITALQALRDTGALKAGQKVLVNGASGGVGTFAIQIAKAMGAEVTGVCSTRNVALVQSLGADHVIDYRQQDFTQGPQHYDLVFDTVGNHALSDLRRVMTPTGTLVMVGGGSDGNWIGPFMGPLKALVYSPFVGQKMTFMLARLNQKDLNALAELMASGKVTPVIDRRYALSELPTAMGYLEEGHARGKVIINLD